MKKYGAKHHKEKHGSSREGIRLSDKVTPGIKSILASIWLMSPEEDPVKRSTLISEIRDSHVPDVDVAISACISGCVLTEKEGRVTLTDSGVMLVFIMLAGRNDRGEIEAESILKSGCFMPSLAKKRMQDLVKEAERREQGL